MRPISVRRRADAHFAQTNILVVADPQILDRRSYPGRAEWLLHLTAFVVDMNMRKSWMALMRLRPHTVVFLGDMMDNGRADMSDEEYVVSYLSPLWSDCSRLHVGRCSPGFCLCFYEFTRFFI